MKENIKIYRIKKQYVGSDCVQVSIPFNSSITLLNKDGIVFSNDIDENNNINMYLKDIRRRNFPYSNITVYNTWNGLFKIKSYTNQLLDYNKVYISIQNGLISELFIVKDKNEAFLVNKILNFDRKTINMNYNQLLDFTYDSEGYDKVLYVYLDGTIPNVNKLYPTENEIYSHIINQLKEKIENFKKYQKDIEHYSIADKWFYDYVKQSIENIDLSLIDYDIDVGKSLVVIKVKGNDIIVLVIEASLVNYNNYKVNIYNMPLETYTLNQIKQHENIEFYIEPKIPLALNHDISRRYVLNQKKIVKILKKQ